MCMASTISKSNREGNRVRGVHLYIINPYSKKKVQTVSVRALVTHVYAVDIDGDVVDGDGVLVASELHLQHALKAPTHEGGVREPRGH